MTTAGQSPSGNSTNEMLPREFFFFHAISREKRRKKKRLCFRRPFVSVPACEKNLGMAPRKRRPGLAVFVVENVRSRSRRRDGSAANIHSSMQFILQMGVACVCVCFL